MLVQLYHVLQHKILLPLVLYIRNTSQTILVKNLLEFDAINGRFLTLSTGALPAVTNATAGALGLPAAHIALALQVLRVRPVQALALTALVTRAALTHPAHVHCLK